MVKNCSKCGKELTFRDSFAWENEAVCKSCLYKMEHSIEPTEQIEFAPNKLSKKVITYSYLIDIIVFILLHFGADVDWIIAFIISEVVGWSIRAYYKKDKVVTDQNTQNGQKISTEDNEEKVGENNKINLVCYDCKYFDGNIGVCSFLHFNILSYPKQFIKKFNGKFYKKN